MATTASVYNTSRTTRQILRRHRKDKPSLILHLHNHHFRFERQNGMFLFDSPVKAFLGYIRDQKVPADLLDVLTESGVQFFEGCLLVDVHDHRSHAAASSSILGPRELHNMSAAGAIAREGRDGASGSMEEGGLASSLFYLQEGGRYGARKLFGATGSTDPRTGGLGGVEIYRIVLHPSSETLWADIKMLDDMTGGMWSDQEALEVEAKILALTAPPLCLTPDPQATRIANLMLSSTALPSACNPSKDSPYRSAKKRGANSIEMEKEEANRQRREKIMRLMQHGHKSALPPQAGMQSALTRSGPAMGESGASTSAAAATAFVPTFDRMTFIERWRIGRNAALNGGLPGAPPPGGAPNAPNGAAAPGAAKGGKEAAKASDKDESADASSTAKKPPSKKKKKAQREKEEAEAVAAAEAAKKKAEEEAAAAAAAAAKKPKKKLTKKEREEKERKEKEEKEKAEKEEKERKEKEAAAAAAANGKPAKPKSKKKQKEEAAAAAAASAETSNKSPAKNAKADAPGSPEKDKKASPKKTAAKKPATTAGATPATTVATPASTGKKKTPAKSDKKNTAAASNTTAPTNGATDFTASAAVQGTPILNSATPSVQSTPTPAHRSIPSQPQQQQQLQQQMQPFTQQQLQQAALAGMFPNMANQLPFGATAPNGSFGMPMMNGFPPTSNPQATAAALAAMQGMGLGQFGGGGGGVNFNNAAQMQQMMSMMNAGGMGFNGMPFQAQGGQQQGQPGIQQQQQQQQQGQGQGQGGDMPVGVGLAGLANWGTGK